MTFWNEGTFVRTAPVQEMKKLEEFWQGAYLCMQLTTFYHQVLFAEPVAKM